MLGMCILSLLDFSLWEKTAVKLWEHSGSLYTHMVRNWRFRPTGSKEWRPASGRVSEQDIRSSSESL